MSKESEKLLRLREAAYKEDASRIKAKPLEVFVPESVEEVRDKVLFNKNITIRGGGSGLAGVEAGNSVLISLEKLNKILALDKQRKEVYVEAGLVLNELNKFLWEHKLEFPIQPLSKNICTIGGMIACNASGFRELRYGRTGNWVQALELINGRGELLKLGKADLADIAGQEGITGIIVRAKLKLVPIKTKTASLFGLNNLEEVVDVVKKLRLMENISMIIFFDKLSSSVLGLEDKYHIIAEFEGEQGKEKGEDYKKILNLIEKVYPGLASLGYTYLEDIKIFLDRFTELAEFLEKNKVPYFADLGVGVIHPCFQENQKNLIALILENVKKLHGKVTGKFGYGVKKKAYIDNIEKKIITRLKSRYDPGYKFNPGVLIDKNEEKAETKELLTEDNYNKSEVKMKKQEQFEEGEEEKEEAEEPAEEQEKEVEESREEGEEAVESREDVEEKIEEKAEKNIEKTEKDLDEELQHDEEVGDSEIRDDLYNAEE